MSEYMRCDSRQLLLVNAIEFFNGESQIFFPMDETNFDAHESRKRINEKTVAKMLEHIESDIQKDVEYKTHFFENIDDADDAWIIDYFYPTQEEKYIGISSGTMDDLKNARRELVDMYIALDGAVTDLKTGPSPNLSE